MFFMNWSELVADENTAANELISLKSDEGTVWFIKLLIMHKDSFPKARCHDNVLEKIRHVLIRKMVIASFADLRDY